MSNALLFIVSNSSFLQGIEVINVHTGTVIYLLLFFSYFRYRFWFARWVLFGALFLNFCIGELYPIQEVNFSSSFIHFSFVCALSFFSCWVYLYRKRKEIILFFFCDRKKKKKEKNIECLFFFAILYTSK